MKKYAVMLAAAMIYTVPLFAAHEFNGSYSGENLNRPAFPIGGMGAGMYCLEGSGAISHMSVKHKMEFFNEPACYAAISLQEPGSGQRVTRVVEGPIPDRKYFGAPGSGRGGERSTFGLPRFRQAEFIARFPFATVRLADESVPVEVKITGWSPFIPLDADASSLPAGALEYKFRNTSGKNQDAVFSFSAPNFMGKGKIDSIDGGFVLRNGDETFAIFVDDEKVSVDHCWFRGGWWDPQTITWNNISSGKVISNPPVAKNAAGASLFVPFTLKAGEEKIIRLMTCWYVPRSTLRYGNRTQNSGPAFGKYPSQGTALGQQDVSGFIGKGLINTYDPGGDSATGTLTSPAFKADKRYLHFLVGGGSHPDTCINLLDGEKVVQSIRGKDKESLEWATIDLKDLKDKELSIQIVDHNTGAWGHINADHFILSNETIDKLQADKGITDRQRVTILADFDGSSYGSWTAEPKEGARCGPDCNDARCAAAPLPDTYVPWYTTKFKSINEVAGFWRKNYENLRQRSQQFSDAFYDTTLPPEVIEAVAANLTILKSPTVLRQYDGRIWAWEGCNDSGGCCAGSCSHVWNYAQALCHLFPELARGMRQTQFFEGQNDAGRQWFRVNLPIAPGGGQSDAADGQLGEIMQTYREWRISGDQEWIRKLWPKVRLAMDYAIRTWDPNHTGLLEEAHHNTYDINYFGPDGHCGSFYLGALAASIRMGEAVGDDTALYRQLLANGRHRMETELYNGEYFIQIVRKEGLLNNFRPINPDDQSDYYKEIAKTVNAQGPKYQYGSGCLSDGVLGLWIARVCGIDQELIDPAKVSSHLKSVYKYNLKHDLSQHSNPQRSTYAMGDDGGLLLCSWPLGDRPLLPFVYSDEVWTGIEYQVASHLIMCGFVDEGLDIVRTLRKRYNGVRRNPFNEYECGHWYARALASYGLLQAMSGARYDAVDKVLYLHPRINGDFKAFISTATGFGSVGIKDGKPFVNVVSGKIEIRKIKRP